MKSHAWCSVFSDKEALRSISSEYPKNIRSISEESVTFVTDSEQLTDLLQFLSQDAKLVGLIRNHAEWKYLYVWVEEEPDPFLDIRPEDVALASALGLEIWLTFDG